MPPKPTTDKDSEPKKGKAQASSSFKKKDKVEREIVSAALVTSGQQDVTMKKDPGIPGDALLVVIPGEGRFPHRSLTIHHPIGVTPLSKDEWVVTQTGDVPWLVSRAKNPGSKSYVQQVEATRLNLAVAQRLLVKKAGKYYYPNLPEKTREEYLHEASNRWLNTLDEKKRKGANPKPENQISHLLDEGKALETAILAFWKQDTTKAAVKAAVPEETAYETLGGPDADQKQVGVAGYKGMTRDQIAAWIGKTILAGPEAVIETPVATPSAASGSKDKGKATAPKNT